MFSFVIEIKKSFLHGQFSSLCHFLSKGLFAVFANVTDTGRTVATENESEELSYHVIMKLTILDFHLALGTSMEAFSHTTLADLAP